MRHHFSGPFSVGLVAGTCVAICLFLILEIVPVPWAGSTTMVGAVLGGAIAGFVSLVATGVMIYGNYLQRLSDKKSEHEAILLSVLLKLIRISDSIVKAKRHYMVNDDYLVMRLTGRDPIWKPLENTSGPECFTLTEKAFFISQRQPESASDLMDIEGISSVLAWVLSKYQDKFSEWYPRILDQDAVRVSGQAISGEFQIRKTDLMPLDDLRQIIIELSKEGSPKITKMTDSVQEVLRSEFGVPVRYAVANEAPGSYVVKKA